MNNNALTYPAEWEKDYWELDTDPVRRAYVAWLQRYPWDLFVTVNFRQKQVYLTKDFHHATGMYVKNVTAAPWGSMSDVESRLKAMDARVCKRLLGRNWASMWNQRPEWMGFIEKDEDGFAHAHLLVNLKGRDKAQFVTAFSLAARYFSPRADIRTGEAFKEIYSTAGATYYSTKFLNSYHKECALTVSPTIHKRFHNKQGTASEV